MPMRLGFIVETRYLRQHMPGAVIDVLIQRGVGVDILNPSHGHFDLDTGLFRDASGRDFDLRRYDGVVSRNRNALGLALLSYAEKAGVPTLNTHTAVQRVRNKADMAIELGLAGVRCARTFLADHAAALADRNRFAPLILKATFGDNSQGLRLVRSAEDLADLHWGNELALAQDYLPNDGFDLKLYVCGRQVFAVRKPSPFNSRMDGVAGLIEPTAQMIQLALRCGRLFGLDLYGVDTLQTPEGPIVIEVNDFPNFTGIPGADALVADHILARIEEVRSNAHRIPAASTSL